MGLLSGVLPAVYSASDALKRKVGGLLSDPVDTLQQHVGLLNDNARSFNQLHSKATQESVNSIKGGGSGFGPASQQLAGKLADAYNPMGMVVWHGSPHKFSKFDSSKIGTGEGSQAYGHGLYLAESPAVARQYQEALAGGGIVKKDGTKLAPQVGYQSNALRVLKDNDYNFDEAIKQLQKPLSGTDDGWGIFASGADKHRTDQLKFLEELKVEGAKFDSPGSLYKVDLPDDAIAKMLDWDKPLSQQAPEVRMIAKDLGISEQEVGAKFYQALTNQARDGAIARGQNAGTTLGASQAAASEDLRAFGIPGIRYLDGGSRGAGGGTSNFVVFPGNEGLLNILERNGQSIK